MSRIIFILSLLMITGCVSGYQKFYESYVEVSELPSPEILEKGEEPGIFGTDNFARDIEMLAPKHFVVIGQSSFNGEFEDQNKVIAQAKRVGATIVLVKSEYTNTQTTTSSLFLPDNKTTYHSGTANAYSSTGSAYGTYSGTSTTYGTKAVPFTTHQRRYDQNAVFLLKINPKMRFGLQFDNLTPQIRREIERNTGAVIKVVYEDMPAFYANLLSGDILLAVEGSEVKNREHAVELMGQLDPTATSAELLILRKGVEKSVEVEF